MIEKYENSEKWDMVIGPKRGLLDLKLKDIWIYRGLIFHFVRRDFVAFYKQTVLGPLWYIIQPLLTTVVFTVVFGRIARISTDGVPPFIFYLLGTVAWGYFAGCLQATSNTFVKNSKIFGKVYFPRLTVPISVAIINLLKFGIQLGLFLAFYIYFIARGTPITPNLFILLLPMLVVQMAILGLGMGVLISSLTTKYRDVKFLLGFGVQLWMYATPIVYPLSSVQGKYRIMLMFNPVTLLDFAALCMVSRHILVTRLSSI